MAQPEASGGSNWAAFEVPTPSEPTSATAAPQANNWAVFEAPSPSSSATSSNPPPPVEKKSDPLLEAFSIPS